MMRVAIVLSLVLIAPATFVDADGIADQYAKAFAVFRNDGDVPSGGSIASQRRAISAMLESMKGRWIPLDLIANKTPSIDASALSSYCVRAGSELTTPTTYRFDLTRGTVNGPKVTMHYDYTRAMTFQKSVDATEFSEWLQLGDPLDDKAAEALSRGQIWGTVSVFRPSPDILILAKPFEQAEIWGRCPT